MGSKSCISIFSTSEIRDFVSLEMFSQPLEELLQVAGHKGQVRGEVSVIVGQGDEAFQRME